MGKRLLLGLLLAGFLSGASADPVVLRVFVHEKGFPPFDRGIGSDGRASGLYPDLMDEICRRTGWTWVPVPLPPGRIYEAFRRQEIDVEVGCNPDWRPDDTALSVYSIPFATDSNVILVRAGESLRWPPRPEDPVVVLGTVLGYRYPSVEPFFQAGRAVRADSGNEARLVAVLGAGRIRGAVMTLAVARELTKDQAGRFEWGQEFDRLPLSIRLHKSQEKLLPELNRVLHQLRAEGKVQGWSPSGGP